MKLVQCFKPEDYPFSASGNYFCEETGLDHLDGYHRSSLNQRIRQALHEADIQDYRIFENTYSYNLHFKSALDVKKWALAFSGTTEPYVEQTYTYEGDTQTARKELSALRRQFSRFARKQGLTSDNVVFSSDASRNTLTLMAKDKGTYFSLTKAMRTSGLFKAAQKRGLEASQDIKVHFDEYEMAL